ncbi:uncharacterized protein LOC119080506 [Bradysia coprophila]|uniref:uncharacterized protein LOC119080506 n=1 Tax=Bradysia coprophila TaxID=38358 RepID=UPI00187D9880|nr:uncharacterized protein LOC119080506 [Bradysia coprophila]
MGLAQSDHSKSYIISIKVPDPIATFPKLPPNEYNFTDLRNKIYYIVKASMDDLPPDYWVILQRLFTLLDCCQSVLSENILKQSASAEYKDTAQRLTALATHIETLNKNIQILLQDGTSDDNRSIAENEGFVSCQEIIRCFSDENGSFYRNTFLSCPCLIISAGIIRSFSKLWLTDGQMNELTKVATPVLLCFKDKCIQERLDNIKMLRTQSVSYNVHDYSYEAQVRKDVTFGGKINDFYDKRPEDEISFRDHPLREVTDADHILAAYKTEVKREYEQLFGALLNDF